MWLDPKHTRKWRPDALESRIYAIAEAEAHANGLGDAEAAGEAMEAVYRVMRWCQSTRSYKQVAEMVEEAYGVKTSPAALSGFWQRFASPYLAETQRRHVRLATDIADSITPEEEARLDRRVWQSIREEAFNALHSPEGNEKAVIALTRSLLAKAKNDMHKEALQLDREKFELLQEKERQAARAKAELTEATAAARKGGLTEETLKRIEEAANLL